MKLRTSQMDGRKVGMNSSKFAHSLFWQTHTRTQTHAAFTIKKERQISFAKMKNLLSQLEAVKSDIVIWCDVIR